MGQILADLISERSLSFGDGGGGGRSAGGRRLVVAAFFKIDVGGGGHNVDVDILSLLGLKKKLSMPA